MTLSNSVSKALPMSNSNAAGNSAWLVAARAIARWLERRERLDELIEAEAKGLQGAERARCQHLVFGVVRHFGRLEASLRRLIAHSPRFSTRAVLFVAGFELIEAFGDGDPAADGRIAKIVHHAVEQTKVLASPAEARLVNAVVRKLATILAAPAPQKLAPAEVLAEYFSHPVWLVRSWLAQFGAPATRALLEWNQRPAPVYARARPRPSGEDAAPLPPWLKPTSWPDFHEVESGHWPQVEELLRAGRIYLQDPATRLAAELVGAQEGECILDACAAPGGKSLLIADRMRTGQLVAMDLPTARIARLKENLSRVPPGLEVALVQGELQRGAADLLREHRLPTEFDAVLLDVPCSNTGVMRHRVDVKWRLQEGDFKKHPRQQLALLGAAARLVKAPHHGRPGGRLVYSTCSIDQEENEHLIREFLGNQRGRFELEQQMIAWPWVAGHDGAGVFRLRRIA